MTTLFISLIVAYNEHEEIIIVFNTIVLQTDEISMLKSAVKTHIKDRHFLV